MSQLAIEILLLASGFFDFEKRCAPRGSFCQEYSDRTPFSPSIIAKQKAICHSDRAEDVADADTNLNLADYSMRLNQIVGLTALVVALTLFSNSSLRAENNIPEEYRIGGFFIGCQAYTFNRFSVFEAIEMTAQAGGKVIEFYPGQKLSREQPDVKWDHNAPTEIIQKVKDKLAEQKVRAVNYGVVGVPKNEDDARKIFAFAKLMGLRAITTESVDAIDTIEKMVKEYDIMVGFHDHPRRPDDPNYKMWDPNYILSVVQNRDSRIGACADTGHWVRSNLKPVDCLRILKGRIISSHLKDLNEMGPRAHDVPYGIGVSDIPAILQELKRQEFSGNISIEYEYHWENSLPEVAQCIGFVRGYGSAKGW